MLVRIVKMSFEAQSIDKFLNIFEQNKAHIRNFEGCEFLELYRDKNQNNIFFTYSYWASESDLENYRHSELFKTVWSETKVLFNAKPEAWSVDKLESLK
ncbi:antibiotic biosynthesis monooxygenase [Hyunsoonleella flava]|uniref:Antibiotic biosynthesis monooxygenase n=1 Tax=Hyunsoonleella flava TaxID=2527939 RepID=A0A4V2JA09_9FLAO|nr:antibiotic biosynthesis monooxygenase family protein [Hyunsoonleella flava]TBN03001.1 antibiotic biosynthesis monooxygenase [Hyunsoonleella flava]